MFEGHKLVYLRPALKFYQRYPVDLKNFFLKIQMNYLSDNLFHELRYLEIHQLTYALNNPNLQSLMPCQQFLCVHHNLTLNNL